MIRIYLIWRLAVYLHTLVSIGGKLKHTPLKQFNPDQFIIANIGQYGQATFQQRHIICKILSLAINLSFHDDLLH